MLTLLLSLALLLPSAFAQEPPPEPEPTTTVQSEPPVAPAPQSPPPQPPAPMPPPLPPPFTPSSEGLTPETSVAPPPRFDVSKKRTAIIQTDMGVIKIELFSREAPGLVANFISLARGEKDFKDARTGQPASRPFYDNLFIHRVSKNFLIQMGCPLGNGRGGPGYVINDEFSFRRHNKPGMVGMANIGRNTNGSQFYITLKPAPFIDGKYSIFGQVISGMDVVRRIGAVKIGPTERPLKNIYIKKIEIEEK